MSTPALLQPLTVRGVTLPNRLVVAPMCQYSVSDGVVGDYHLVHLGRFALGGFGTVVVEATGVTPQGRISHGDVGLWDDGQVPGLPGSSTSSTPRARSPVSSSRTPAPRPAACGPGKASAG